MSNYTIQSIALNKSRVFILQKSELEKRLDPFYYVPELLELEKKVLSKSQRNYEIMLLGFQAVQHQKQLKAKSIIPKKKTAYRF